MLKKWMAAAALMGMGIAHAFAPQAGTWVVTSELNGKPGRGLAIDVQDKTLVMQMYAYDPSGNATFYLTSGAINNNQYTGTLNKYRGGRYLGSGDLIGQDDGSVGVVKMRFDSGTKGYITFPGEPEKAISRYSFAYSANPQSLKGLWLLTPINSLTPQADFVSLVTDLGPSDYGSGMVATKDGRFGCDNIIKGANAGTVVCVKMNAANQLVRGYQFQYSVNDGEGVSGVTTANLNDPLIVRRMTSTAGDGTGILFKHADAETPADAADPALLRQALEQAVSELQAE